MDTLQLSVVIASHNASRVIGTCLTALAPQSRARQMEVIVADSSADGTAGKIARDFPWVRLLHFDEPLPIQSLRGRGIAVARGEVIAILDPFSVAAPDWADGVAAAHARRPNAVIGGSVDLYRAESCSWSAWAVYLYEYGLFMPPVREGETWIVPGSNVSYKRSALFDGSNPRYRDFWKTFANWEIEGAASPLWLAADVRVALNKPITLRDFLSTRYDHGRCFGGMRVRGAAATTRLWRAASTVLVPMLLTWRWTRGFWPKRRRRLRFILTLPAQIALFGVWAAGEACGYLFGMGRSCARLFY